jgi:hypothetical protein
MEIHCTEPKFIRILGSNLNLGEVYKFRTSKSRNFTENGNLGIKNRFSVCVLCGQESLNLSPCGRTNEQNDPFTNGLVRLGEIIRLALL